MLTWPHPHGAWADSLEAVEAVFRRLACAIAQRQNLLINCHRPDSARRLRSTLQAAGVAPSRLFLHSVASDDSWARDHGPVTVVQNARPRLIDFRFNGWGNKYPAAQDDAINAALHLAGAFGEVPMTASELVLEGGSVDSDGLGSLLTTTSCLLHPQRNPALTLAEIERRLADLLGAERLLWLENGCIEGDDTDGHIDMLARFVDPRTIVYQSCDEKGYACYDSLAAMQAELEALRDRDGRPYRLLPLPWPQPKLDRDSRRMPASYANFLLINGAVLLPTYDDPADERAVGVLRACFPEREIVPIDCLPLIAQHGSLHCLTMQFPAGVDFSPGTL